jgi:threonine synthase
MRAVRETEGAFVTVTDEEILKAIPTLARGCGVFAEPAGASSFAGLVKAVHTGLVKPDERIVVLATGSGLKDIRAAMQTMGKPQRIRASLEAVEAALSDHISLWHKRER